MTGRRANGRNPTGGAAHRVALPEIPDLNAALGALLAQIPAGRVATYGDLADALGDRSAARWVGERLVDHPHDDACRCHRVVLKSGLPGRYVAGTADDKLRRLRAEGVAVDAVGSVDLALHRVTAFASDRPLATLAEFQRDVPRHVVERQLSATPDTVAAVDLAYDKSGQGVAALAVVETSTGRLVRSSVLRRPVPFPYITGYLAFREVGLMRDLVESEPDPPAVLLVDGNGRLHPRRAGIATTLGVLLDLPTIGVGKKLLAGRVELDDSPLIGPRLIRDGNEILGAELRATESSNPIYVSVGHQIDLPSAVALCRSLFFGHRLPEPQFQADRLSKEAARS